MRESFCRRIKTFFDYRHLFFALVIRDLKEKYKNSLLGIFWSLLNPLLNVLIFAFVFAVIIKIDIKDYPLYLLSTMFAWNFFNTSLINAVVSIVEDNHFVKNTPFPNEIIPLAVVAVNLINFIIDLVILFLVLFFLGKSFKPAYFYIPFLVLIEFILASGLAIFLSGLYVIFRDLNFILNLFLRLFFYFIPVVYTISFVPSGLRFFYLLNPLAVIIDGFARVLFYSCAPDFKLLAFAFLESVIIFILCLSAFQRLRNIIPERL